MSGRGGDDGSEGGRSGVARRSDDGDDRSEGKSTVEKAVMAVSVAFTLLLFAYAGWQLVAVPSGGVPAASVADSQTLSNGSVAVTVRVRNPSNVGLITATVESPCTDPPVELQFTYLPADATRTGTLVCPPGSTSPTVSVTSWERA